MANYDSDSSGADDIETNVLLGYASKTPTSDEFSQLGGHPTWLDDITGPPGALAKCTVCQGLMNLLLQLHGDIPQRFPDHERRLYLWACRRKACRRKDGSIRGFRAVRSSRIDPAGITASESGPKTSQDPAQKQTSPSSGLGEAVFGVKPSSSTSSNPFASPSTPSNLASANPFATASSLAAKPAQKPISPQSLSQSFADKVKISSPSTEPTTKPPNPTPQPTEPWPPRTAFPKPFPSYHIDADKEYLDPENPTIPANARLDPNAMDTDEPAGGSSRGKPDDLKDVFESSMDKTFQRFADRLAQNPEQILRYEFGAQPLLYSRTDGVGKLLAQGDEHNNNNNNNKITMVASTTTAQQQQDVQMLQRIPKCGRCGAARCFELQLTPHAIAELEADELSLDGMDWGSIVLAVCSQDCAGGEVGKVEYLEEWVGVQWEEMEVRKK